jgi:ATP-dependent Clp protease ATP-binding subunit ClpX
MNDNEQNNNPDLDDQEEKEFEDVCFACRRPESKAGKMLKLPNQICVCDDCMQKTMDAISQFDYQGMLNNPQILNELHNIDNNKKGGIPNISFVNLADLQGDGGIPNKQKLRRKKKSGAAEGYLDISDIPPPHKIKAKLDDYIIGQEQAKKVISVAVYNHYKRVATDTMDEIEIEKSNMLMIGPTGCGKTYLVKTLARLLDVPLAIADATSLTEAGYIGDDIESVVSKLLAAADNDLERAEQGNIFLDEIDKIAKKKDTHARDVSGESVQQGMLKLLEGAEVEVPVGANSKNAMVPLATINTRNILFICGGAFPDLDEIVKQRLKKQTAIGFNAELKDKFDKMKNIHNQVTVEDLKKFGMVPEFIGRLPVVFTLDALTEEMMARILSEPKNAILKQYQKLLELDEVQLVFDQGAITAIAKKAMEKDTGARALRAIIEEFMLDIMFEIPKDENIGRVVITKEYIEGSGGPLIEIRENRVIPLLQQKGYI